jgi:hypothetical protein
MGVKRVGVGGGVRARDATDVGLVDGDDLVEMLEACDGIVFAGFIGCAIKPGWWAARSRISKISEDLPEPETPVTATRRLSGIWMVRFFRLYWRAP